MCFTMQLELCGWISALITNYWPLSNAAKVQAPVRIKPPHWLERRVTRIDNVASLLLRVPSKDFLLMHLNLKTLQLKLDILLYKLLGPAVLQQFLKFPIHGSQVTAVSVVAGGWLLLEELAVSCWREDFSLGILPDLPRWSFLFPLWLDNYMFFGKMIASESQMTTDVCTLSLFSLHLFYFRFLSSALLNLSFGVVLKVHCKQ